MKEKSRIQSCQMMLEQFSYFKTCGIILNTESIGIERRLFKHIQDSGYEAIPLGYNKFEVVKKNGN